MRKKRYRFQRGKKFKHNLSIHAATASPYGNQKRKDTRKVHSRTLTSTHGYFQTAVIRTIQKIGPNFISQNTFPTFKTPSAKNFCVDTHGQAHRTHRSYWKTVFRSNAILSFEIFSPIANYFSRQ